MEIKSSVKPGDGKISGYISIFLGVLTFLGVFCFKYPELLTTPDFRAVYTGKSMRLVLISCIIASLFFAVLSFYLSKNRKLSLIGIVFSVLTIVFGGFAVEPSAVDESAYHLGLDWLILDLFLMAIIFVPIETVFPKRKDQATFHEEWRTDLIYFTISHLFVQFFGTIVQQPAKLFFGGLGLDGIHHYIQSFPFILQVFLALFLTDLFQYWAHRIFHRYHYMWRFHSIHHSTINMDWLAGSRTHFLDIFLTRSLSFIPVYLLGFSTPAFNLFIIIFAVHSVFIHSNTRINLGLLKYLVVTPQYHHWHHCKNPKYYGKNYASIFPVIDKIFGTYYLPKDAWPKDTGLLEMDFPKGFINQTVYPFTKNPFNKDLNMKKYSDR